MVPVLLHRRPARPPYAALLLLFLLILPPAVQAEVVDHIAAAVNNEVITASELAQVVALNVRIGKPEPDRKKLESETLEGIVNRRLLIQEARRLKFVEVSDQEVAADLDRIKKRFGSPEDFAGFLKTTDLTEDELARMLGEQLLVEKFVEKKIGLFVRVTREDEERFFTDHADRFKGKRFQDVQKNITALLTDRKVGEQLDQYVAELRGKAEIRINRP